MANQAKTVFSIPTYNTPEQRRFHTISKEDVDNEFDTIATNLESDNIVQRNFPDQVTQDMQLSIDRDNLEGLFMAQKSQEQAVLAQRAAYVLQIDELLESFRVSEVGS